MGNYNPSYPLTLKKPLFLIRGKTEQDKVINQENYKSLTEGQTGGSNKPIEGLVCKYCGEVVEGNRGNLLSHIRKCEKRT